ncbi:MAG: hypothetical protein CL946_13250 [Ectothiorhodospiraceae bacterium]|nr:hypothetical protein [Ectothiorhodospiraceae bacterium]
METAQFKELLFETAIFVRAADGKMNEDNIREIQSYSKIASYFKDLDCDRIMADLLAKLRTNHEHAMEVYFHRLREAELTLIQELLILEIIMRMMHVTEAPSQREIEFLKSVRTRLKVYNEIILERFGEVDYLVNKKYADVKETEEENYLEEMRSPDLMKFNDVDLNDTKI